MEHVFLSYSRRDAAFVGRLADDLVTRGIEPWVDTDDLRTEGDDRWRRSVVRSIRDSAAVILVLSPDSVRSVSVERELTIAAEMTRRIIPILHRQCTLSDGVMFDLAGLQRTDFVDQPYASAFEELVDRVHAGASPGAALSPPATGTADADRTEQSPPEVEAVGDADTDRAANIAVELNAQAAPTEHPRRTRDPSARRGGRRLVAAAVVLALIAIGFLALGRIGDPEDEGATGPVATPSATERTAATTAPAGGTTERTLVPWDVAFATLERVDGTTAVVKASSVRLACTTDTLKFMNGQTISLDRVESVRFDAVFLDDASANGAVMLLDGRELTDPIHTWNCPVGGTTELGPLEIPLEDIKRIDFSR
jgi:hypothetical protein